MTKKLAMCCIALLYISVSSVYAQPVVVNHQLVVKLMPAQQKLQVTDIITLSQQSAVDFTLHAGLRPQINSNGATLIKTGQIAGEVGLETYRVQLPQGQTSFTLSYEGRIAHDFSSRTESPGREQKLLAGTISTQGVFLDGGVAWYARIHNALQTFTLAVDLPDNWTAVSQGKGPHKEPMSAGNRVTWMAEHPQDDIYLIAGQYQFYEKTQQAVSSQVFLRQPDAELAQRYLDVTRYYLDLYEQLIGEYPYAKFALVENFWETGYGMPSFTLLGPRVIRLPFILHSSYPHEILHNWWGNGVFVDFNRGNWSEGLTAYLADHLIKEQQGGGVQHRRVALQRYASFVRSDNDFPLIEFRSRHSGSSQSVGYDKSMMFFHMLRKNLGDQTFIDGLRYFYKANLFKTAGFAELQQAFEQVSEKDLSGFFQQWLEREGAPALKIEDLQLTKEGDGYNIEGKIRQTQSGKAFSIQVPVIVYMGAGTEPKQITLAVNNKSQSFSFQVPATPLRIDFDPWFDLFRQLDSAEAPPTLSSLFGSEKILFVLPGSASKELLEGYQNMASHWARGYQSASIKFDQELVSLPEDRPVWLLGWNNRFFKDFVKKMNQEQFTQDLPTLTLSGHEIDKKGNSIVMTQRNQHKRVTGWVGTDSPQSLAGLTRKLPHYGKYSYLVFAGVRPDIQHKGQWPVTRSPLKIMLTDSGRQIQEVSPKALWPKNAEVKN